VDESSETERIDTNEAEGDDFDKEQEAEDLASGSFWRDVKILTSL
jgi:hypothetical protein